MKITQDGNLACDVYRRATYRCMVLRARGSVREVADMSRQAKSLFFLSVCSNRNAVHVDSRLHFATSQLTITLGGQHGEEKKEGSGEEDKAQEEEVGVCRFMIFDC
jgi:hypothetical protein